MLPRELHTCVIANAMNKSAENFTIRVATEADIPSLHALIETSVRVLQKNDYTPEQIDGALGTVFLVVLFLGYLPVRLGG